MKTQSESADLWDVVVVGAGPTGLLLAGELAAQGLRVAVLERDLEPDPTPKGNGIVGRASVELAKRGVFAGTDFKAIRPPRFQFGPIPLRLGLWPASPLHILPIPQRRLEELLERRAVERGAEVRRGHVVLGIQQTEARVEAEVIAGGAPHRMLARYVVGCDGARSTVRKSAGIDFPGFTSDEISRIARVTIPAGRITRKGEDFEIPGAGRVAAMRPNRLPGGGFSIAPARALDPTSPKDLYVISTHEARRDTDPREALTADDLRASLHRVLGADLPFTDATAMRTTVGNSRIASTYRAGRVLLAGDAAHIFNAGGSSLNAGLLDALELASRLTAALRSGSPEGLDAYEKARRPAGLRTLSHTRVQAALSRDDGNATSLREIMGHLLASRGAARRLARLLDNP
ncbi:FAD-dependent oxidoreductase [Sinomonas sp. G460-2]|uniref:FAD-dependent oxidoreductase n=1 Tax=Sinomonas sp. G460-2 TaxID=3393464 RepID=UPI0039EE06A4